MCFIACSTPSSKPVSILITRQYRINAARIKIAQHVERNRETTKKRRNMSIGRARARANRINTLVLAKFTPQTTSCTCPQYLSYRRRRRIGIGQCFRFFFRASINVGYYLCVVRTAVISCACARARSTNIQHDKKNDPFRMIRNKKHV